MFVSVSKETGHKGRGLKTTTVELAQWDFYWPESNDALKRSFNTS